MVESLPRDLTIEQIVTEINKTMQRDAELEKEIDSLLLQRHDLEHKLSSLQDAVPLLEAAEASAIGLHGRIERTSGLAHEIVSQVRELDVAQTRLQLVLARVDCALDLTATRDAVARLVAAQQYATVCVSWFLDCRPLPPFPPPASLSFSLAAASPPPPLLLPSWPALGFLGALVFASGTRRQHSKRGACCIIRPVPPGMGVLWKTMQIAWS